MSYAVVKKGFTFSKDPILHFFCLCCSKSYVFLFLNSPFLLENRKICVDIQILNQHLQRFFWHVWSSF